MTIDVNMLIALALLLAPPILLWAEKKTGWGFPIIKQILDLLQKNPQPAPMPEPSPLPTPAPVPLLPNWLDLLLKLLPILLGDKTLPPKAVPVSAKLGNAAPGVEELIITFNTPK